MSVVVYAFCALTAMLCAWLLLRSYGSGGYRLLLWSGLCFVGLTISNTLLVLDKVTPWIDLSLWRGGAALIAMGVLLYGLIFDTE